MTSAKLKAIALIQRYPGRMATVQVRNLDDETYAVLRTRAAVSGQSLQEYLRVLLTEAAQRPTLNEAFARIEAHTGGRLSLDEATDLVREDRDGR
jgi:antitoxin FitA